MSDTYGLDDRFAKDKDGNTVTIAKVGDPKPAYSTEAVEANEKKSTGNRLKFKLEFMIMMLQCDRNEEAGKMYNQLIAEFDKLA